MKLFAILGVSPLDNFSRIDNSTSARTRLVSLFTSSQFNLTEKEIQDLYHFNEEKGVWNCDIFYKNELLGQGSTMESKLAAADLAARMAVYSMQQHSDYFKCCLIRIEPQIDNYYSNLRVFLRRSIYECGDLSALFSAIEQDTDHVPGVECTLTYKNGAKTDVIATGRGTTEAIASEDAAHKAFKKLQAALDILDAESAYALDMKISPQEKSSAQWIDSRQSTEAPIWRGIKLQM